MNFSIVLMAVRALCLVAITLPIQASGLVAPVQDSYPQLSPDQNKIVFQSNRSGVNQIWLMNADGTGLRQLTQATGQGAETPAWSPDGKHIVFALYVAENNNDVFTMRADGSEQKRLTFSPGHDDHPSWSADGQFIVFNSNRDTPDIEVPWHLAWHDIWSIRPDGSDTRKLLACQTVCTYGSLSPDGTSLLYRRVDDSTGLNWLHEAGMRNSEIYLLDLESGISRIIAPHPAFDGWPAWSPDGDWILFASNRGSAPLQGQLWKVRPDGTELQQLTDGDWSHAQGSWAAGGELIMAFRFQETLEAETGHITIIEHSIRDR